MLNKIKNNHNLSIYFLIAVIVAVISFSLLSPIQQKAYAESSEIVNFNQLLRFTSATSYVSRVDNNVGLRFASGFNSQFPATIDFNAIANHKYYLFNDNNNGDFRLYLTGGVTQEFNTIYSPYSNISITQLFVVSPSNVELNKNIHFNIIDLTLMGIDNYTLEQCQNLFTSDYYSYTTGTPVNLNGFGSYAQGVIDTLGNTYLTLNENILSGLLTAYNYGGYSSEVVFDQAQAGYLFTGFGLVNLGYQISQTTQFDFEGQIYQPNMNNKYMIISAFNGNDIYIVGNIDVSNYNFTGSITLPAGTDKFLICFSDSSTGYSGLSQVVAYQIKMSYNSVDIQGIVNTMYNAGLHYNQAYYSEGGDGYTEIWYQGYNRGLAQASNVIGESWDFIGGTFTSLGQLFNIELMPNITLGLFIAIPLLLGLLLFILKITRS